MKIQDPLLSKENFQFPIYSVFSAAKLSRDSYDGIRSLEFSIAPNQTAEDIRAALRGVLNNDIRDLNIMHSHSKPDSDGKRAYEGVKIEGTEALVLRALKGLQAEPSKEHTQNLGSRGGMVLGTE